MQDFRGDRDQYPLDLNRCVEKFAKRSAPAIEIDEIGILRDSGEDRLAVCGHALMDAVHFGREVHEGVHRNRDQHVKRVNAVRIRGRDRIVIDVLPFAEPRQPVERLLDGAATRKLQHTDSSHVT